MEDKKVFCVNCKHHKVLSKQYCEDVHVCARYLKLIETKVNLVTGKTEPVENYFNEDEYKLCEEERTDKLCRSPDPKVYNKYMVDRCGIAGQFYEPLKEIYTWKYFSVATPTK